MKKLMKISMIVMASFALAVAGCGGDDDDSDGDGGGGGGGLGGGDYTMTITNVDDGCYDGAMKTLILGDESTPTTFPVTGLPAGGADGTVTKIDFNDPFQDVEAVPVKAQGDNGLTTGTGGIVSAGTNISATGTCNVDVTFAATITYATADSLAGTATMTIGDLPDPADDCPELTGGAGCAITITLSGAK